MQQPKYVVPIEVGPVYAAKTIHLEAACRANKAMRVLYDLGCRRMEIRYLPRTDDDLLVEVSGR